MFSRLFLTVVALAVALVMVASVSYAWLTISGSPEVNGISVSIGGGTTILIAPNVAASAALENGETVTVNYPGAFSDSMEFLNNDSYSYLSSLAGLSPVSTADGVNWMIPQYDEYGVLSGFSVDSDYRYANSDARGGYVYLDFWIVSPGADYDVRLSTDAVKREGSYLVELPDVVSGENGLKLVMPDNRLAASARVGFLVCDETVDNADMLAYTRSENYDERYITMHGGEGSGQFTIYEPNALAHPGDDAAARYVPTMPIAADGTETDVALLLTAQEAPDWNGAGVPFDQIFAAATANKQELSAEQAKSFFYTKYLQNNLDGYIRTGLFYKNAAELYYDAENAETAGAADNAVIARLHRDIPQRVRMFIWLEGQDCDCVNEGKVDASALAVRIELAGASR